MRIEWDDEFQQKIWNSFGFWAWQQKLWNLRVVVHSFRLFRIHRTQRWIEHVCTPLQKPIHPLFLLFVITPWYIPFFDVLSLADSPVQLAIGTHQPGMLSAIGFNEENYGCTHIHDRKIKANAHVCIYIVCVCMYVCMYHVGIEIWVWIKTLVPLWTSKMAGTWMLIPQICFQRF